MPRKLSKYNRFVKKCMPKHKSLKKCAKAWKKSPDNKNRRKPRKSKSKSRSRKRSSKSKSKSRKRSSKSKSKSRKRKSKSKKRKSRTRSQTKPVSSRTRSKTRCDRRRKPQRRCRKKLKSGKCARQPKGQRITACRRSVSR